MIPAFLRPFLSGLLLIPLMSLAGWIAAHNGPTIPTEQVHKLVDYLLELVFPLFAGGAVLFRRAVDKKVNPDNAASTGAVMAGKAKQRQRKQTRAVEDRLQKAGVTDGEGEDPEAPKWYRPPGE